MIAAAGALTSAAAYVLLFAPYEQSWLGWVALVPLFLVLDGAPPRRASAASALWAALATAGVVGWLVPTLRDHFGLGAAASGLVLLGLAVTAAAPWCALAFAAAAATARRLPPAAGPLLLAAAFVAAEFARTELGIRSPWARLGDAFYGAERLRQMAALGGVYAVTGVVALSSAALARSLSRLVRNPEGGLRSAAGWAALAAAVPLLALGHGELRNRRVAPAEGAPLRVLLVQGNVPPELRWSRRSAHRVLRRYQRLTLAGLRKRPLPDLIVWPENAIQTAPDDPVYGPPVVRVASGVPLLLGAPRSELRGGTRHHFNSAHLLHPDGRREHYDKRRLLPLGEAPLFGGVLRFGRRGDLDADVYTPGSRPGIFRVGGRRLAVLICFEALYPELAREAATLGAELLVNLSNDGWYRGRGGAGQHLAQAVFRAVETGLPLVRATTTGISAVISPDGELLASLGERQPGTLRVEVPLPRGRTAYAATGDLFAGVAAGLVLSGPVVALAGRLRKRRSRPVAAGAAPGAPRPDGPGRSASA